MRCKISLKKPNRNRIKFFLALLPMAIIAVNAAMPAVARAKMEEKAAVFLFVATYPNNQRDIKAYRYLDYPTEWDNPDEAYEAAKGLMDAMCAKTDSLGAVAAYPFNIHRNRNEGKIVYSVAVYSRPCTEKNVPGTNRKITGRDLVNFAVTGYGGLCPVAGWYHNGTVPTHDCIKHQNPTVLGPYWNNKYDYCGHYVKKWVQGAVNDCDWPKKSRKDGYPWSTVYGGNDMPDYIEKRVYYDFEYQSDALKKRYGSVQFMNSWNNAYLGTYYIHNGDNQLDYFRIDAWYSWNDDIPEVSGTGESKVKTDSHQSWETKISTGRPGEKAYWKHYFNIDKCSGLTGDGKFDSWVAGNSSGIRRFLPPVGCGENTDRNSARLLVANDTGKTICENAGARYLYKFVDMDNKGNTKNTTKALFSRTTKEACVYVPYHVPGCQGDSCTPSEECRKGDGSSCTNTNLSQSGVVASAKVMSNGNDISGSSVTYGQHLDFGYAFTNRYGPSKSPKVDYTAHVFVLGKGESIPDKYQSFNHEPTLSEVANGNRAYHRSAKGKTDEINPNDSWSKVYSNDGNLSLILDTSMGDPGDYVCAYVVAGPNASMVNDKPSDTYIASPVRCVQIAKKPQMQINGSDSYAAEGFLGTEFSGNISARGSYTQFSQLTKSEKSSAFGSAGYTQNSGGWWIKMIYANAENYWKNSSSKSIAAGQLERKFPTINKPLVSSSSCSVTGGQLDLTGCSTDEYVRVSAKGPLNITGQRAVAGLIYVDGDVTITGNVGDSGQYNNNGTLTIYATGNISINASVSMIHANLIAGGQIITCSGVTNNGQNSKELAYNGVCSQTQLKIIGALASKSSPRFWRTNGAGGQTSTDSEHPQSNRDWAGATSEWIDYTPDVWYLPNRALTDHGPKSYKTVSVRSLPVRY